MRIGRTSLFTLAFLGLTAHTLAAPPDAKPAAAANDTTSQDKVQFNRDIRPILAQACLHCHGPDENQRKADLRLDVRETALADRGGYAAIVPGKPGESELVARITSDDDSLRMPPADQVRQLSQREKELLTRWVRQGAEYQRHWSLIPPRRPELPQVEHKNWPRNGLDYFVLARLEREGLAPSPEADKATLIRRVTLDLTGLPPTPEEVDAFVADDSPDAYEKLVDHLLRSPHYGERMALHWLDAARYADTNGYQNDGNRSMWRWRDWVIGAFNRNMPFDRFTLWQIAGDMLPEPTLEQRIATGFNRNHRGNSEGGVIPEEYRVEYVVDRVDTTATVWLGLTMKCGRCHDHKYDPVTQEEFYQVFAYFNNVPERGRAVREGNTPPVVKAPTEKQQARLDALDRQLAEVEQRLEDLEPRIAQAQAEWEAGFAPEATVDWAATRGLVGHWRLDGSIENQAVEDQENEKKDSDKQKTKQKQDSKDSAGRFHGDGPAYSSGRVGQAAEFDGQRHVEAGDVGDFAATDRFSFGAWIYPVGDQGGTILSRMDDDDDYLGYELRLAAGHLQANIVNRWLDDSLRIETERKLEPGRWHHVFMTYDGSTQARGMRLYVDGREEPFEIHHDLLNNPINVEQPLRIGSRRYEERFHGRIDEVRVYGAELTPEEVAILAAAEPVGAIISTPQEKRTREQRVKLRSYFLANAAGDEFRAADARVKKLRRQRKTYWESLPTVMVMQEMDQLRETHILNRGEYDKPGMEVEPGVPASLHPLPEDAPNNRLGFARWLIDPANPLTARVTVNRFWQSYFGTGLVKTTEDFGTQGEWPSHPELLDWLATRFMDSGWDVKAMQKLIVTSATYRQSSKVTPELRERDPENRLLARGPRIRLSAQVIRDQALAASGLLVDRIGGPSVKPYQPEGLWKEVTPDKVYKRDDGEALYRRSMYTFWKRTVAPPAMTTFDAASRETCVVRQERTNTPLQALNLLNDVTYVEAARHLAERAMKEAGPDPGDRVTRAFRLVLARRPRDTELKVLLDGFQRHLARYREQPEAAHKLLQVGESGRDKSLPAAEAAAYTAIASVILNLDEAITKQ